MGTGLLPRLSGTGRVCRGLDTALEGELEWLGERDRPVFGRCEAALLVSVRSGAAVSMPGMMETVLNVGFTDATLPPSCG